jgi:outer membrane receptor protein involved in Fe transport
VTGTLERVLPPMLFGALSNDASGAPIVALLSYSNFGSATTAGVEVGATYLLPAGWRIHGSYTGFHSSVSDIPENPLLPNSPSHQFSVRRRTRQVRPVLSRCQVVRPARC